MIPLYNHTLLALPITEEDILPLYKDILSSLWTKTVYIETFQKRRLVARK
jgi:hypothetical protein